MGRMGSVLGSAMLREASWSRSNFSWGMSQFKRPNDILAASSAFDQRSMTILVSSRILEIAEGLPTIPPESSRSLQCVCASYIAPTDGLSAGAKSVALN
jgi:hypothetical protein